MAVVQLSLDFDRLSRKGIEMGNRAERVGSQMTDRTELRKKLPAWRYHLAMHARTIKWEERHASDEDLLNPREEAGKCAVCHQPAKVKGFGQTVRDSRTRPVELCLRHAMLSETQLLLRTNTPSQEMVQLWIDLTPLRSGRKGPCPDLDMQEDNVGLNVSQMYTRMF